MATYKLTLSERILEVLQDNLKGSLFKSYFTGYKAEIGRSYLPAVMVAQRRSEITHGATSTDRRTSTLEIFLIIERTTQLNREGRVMEGQQILEHYMEGRNDSTGEYIDESILGVLRRKFTLANTVIDQEVDIDYAEIVRDDGSILLTAVATVTVRESFIVSNRT